MALSLETIRRIATNLLGGSGARKYILTVVVVIVLAAALWWIFDSIFFLFLSRHYVDEIASVFDLNRHLASAITLVVLAVSLGFARLALSFSRKRRMAGIAGMFTLLVLNSLVLWRGTRDQFFAPGGNATKCYVLTRSGVHYGERPGIDAQTGKPCLPVTAELMERLQAYAQGKRPEPVKTSDPVFFDLKTGEPVIWYASMANDEIEIFDLMGFHPTTGEELRPITKDIAGRWRAQQRELEARPPTPVDPQDYVFFDPKTGKPRAWYWHSSEGAYEFYDNKGFHPKTGESLQVVTSAVLEEWRKQSAKKCYYVTRDTVVFGATPGIDAQTGRDCRLLTPTLTKRLKDYEKGLRPKRVTQSDFNFFDLRTGEPNAWYSLGNDGQIKLFDLVGFDPESGQELVPVTAEIVNKWKKQLNATPQKPPKQVDPKEYSFFDSVSGEPRVWFWHGTAGEWEFYDNPGFRSTGEKLTLVSPAVIEAWQKDLADQARAAEAKAAEEERVRRAAEVAKQHALEVEKNAQEEQTARLEAAKQSGEKCDRLAANPYDKNKPDNISGVEYNDLKANAPAAAAACAEAVRFYPQEARYKYNQARALGFFRKQQAINIYVRLTNDKYPAAFDNFADLIWDVRNNLPGAIKQYEEGVRLGDPSAMVSLASLIQRNLYTVKNSVQRRHDLLVSAAQAGHAKARAILENEEKDEQARLNQQQIDQQQKQQQDKVIIDIIGGIARGMGRP